MGKIIDDAAVLEEKAEEFKKAEAIDKNADKQWLEAVCFFKRWYVKTCMQIREPSRAPGMRSSEMLVTTHCFRDELENIWFNIQVSFCQTS